jgi:hypothetical protein
VKNVDDTGVIERAALLLILAGCTKTAASVGTDAVACSAFEPIRWSTKDTDETIRRVKELNAASAALCVTTPDRQIKRH